jgi:two-component system chemotaxis sensor kinase CheA
MSTPAHPQADLRQELLAAFAVEYRDHLAAVRLGLAGARLGTRPDLRELFRRLHSLKGAARAVDLLAAESLAHALESEMAQAMEAAEALPAGWPAAIEAGLDRLEAAIETGLAEDGAADTAPAAQPGAESAAQGAGYLPIDAAQVADLVIATGALAQAIERQQGLVERISALEAAITTARRPQRAAPAAPERARLAEVARQAASLRHEARDLARTVGQSFRRVRDDVHRLSLASAEAIFGPMARMVRDLAREEGVLVEPEFHGLGLAADRRLLQALKDPVMQLLRNAVSHGTEPPAPRRARGLPPATRILLSLRGGGAALTLTVSDDGPGPNLPAIRARGVELGLLRAASAEAASVDDLLSLVFEPGFSTRPEVGPLSGRGMGLSIVAETVRAFGGTARMRIAHPGEGAGYGTAVDITVPLLISRQSAVLLRFDDVTVALPAASVLRLLRVPLAAIWPLAGQMCLRLEEKAGAEPVPLAVLGALLGMAGPRMPAADGMVTCVVIRGGGPGQRLALAVDDVAEMRHFLTHRADFVGIEPELVAGLVMVTSERPAALLSPDGLHARWSRVGGWNGEVAGADEGPSGWRPSLAGKARPRTILVVDDSITSRTLEKSILEAHGYQVRLAVDGVEALAVLRADQRRAAEEMAGGEGPEEGHAVSGIDMVLADVEMPRMDGFALLRTMKDDPGLRRIPVIIMTSRDTAGDIRRGLELGASAYIAKQSFDQQELLAAIGRFL